MTDKIAKQSAATLEVPKGLEGMITQERPAGKDEGTLGSEGIGRDDVLMPRLAIAQKMSPEIDPTVERYIEGLQFTDLYHSLSKKNFGKGPVFFVILRRDDPRWIEFNPLSQGGGIKDRNERSGDPRTKFGPNGEKPVATEFHDFICLLLNDFDPTDPMQNVVALSLKSSGLKAAKHLNLLIEMRGQKLICKGVYKLTTGSATDKKTQGVYAIYKIENAGWLTPDSSIEKLAIDMFDAWKDRKVVVDDDQFVDPDAFDAEKIEARAEM
jgi:hypothetical protein